MIIAIPVIGERLSSHFTKTEWIDFYDGQSMFVARCVNPAKTQDTCAGKSDLLALLIARNTEYVIVRNIGQNMLEKLLAAGIKVFQATTSDMKTILLQLAQGYSEFLPLTDAIQGRPSVNHQQCQQHNEHHHCHHAAGSETAHVPCCQKSGEPSGKNRCCHQHHGH